MAVEDDEAFAEFRRCGRDMPCDPSAPVMTYESRAGFVEVGKKPADICRQLVHGELAPCFAFAEAPQVQCYYAEAGRREWFDLVAPTPPCLREAVKQEHQRPTSLLHEVKPGAIERDVAMLYRQLT